MNTVIIDFIFLIESSIRL